jgi:biopolymer transport protein ExbD
MRRSHIPQAHSEHPNVTPLIDVVMCLIIFFMLVAKIGVAVGVDQSIQLPVSVLGRDLDLNQKDPGNALILNVRAGLADEPTVTALVDATTREPQEIKLSDSQGKNPLFEVLKRLREGDPKNGIPARPELKVNIRADADMEYRFQEKVLITCMQAKIKNLNFNTKQPQ